MYIVLHSDHCLYWKGTHFIANIFVLFIYRQTDLYSQKLQLLVHQLFVETHLMTPSNWSARFFGGCKNLKTNMKYEKLNLISLSDNSQAWTLFGHAELNDNGNKKEAIIWCIHGEILELLLTATGWHIFTFHVWLSSNLIVGATPPLMLIPPLFLLLASRALLWTMSINFQMLLIHFHRFLH